MGIKEEINEELSLVNYKQDDIKSLIYCIRGKQVMLDSDVAMLYHYKTKRINETVRRNKERFPENFCFQLNNIEMEALRRQIDSVNFKNENLRSQFATSNLEDNTYGGRRYQPYVFTEQGIAMLSRIIKK